MIYGDNPQKINKRQDALGLTTYTTVPQLSAILQSGNLYVYGINDPVQYADHTGEFIFSVSVIIAGAVAGAIINAGLNIRGQVKSGVSFDELNWASVGVSAGFGAISGAVAGSPIGLAGQVGINALLGGAESAIQDKVYGREIDWAQVGIDVGIGALVGLVGGRGAQAPKKIEYGRFVSGGGNFTIVSFSYTNRVGARIAFKELRKGFVKSGATQILISDAVIKIIYKEDAK